MGGLPKTALFIPKAQKPPQTIPQQNELVLKHGLQTLLAYVTLKDCSKGPLGC